MKKTTKVMLIRYAFFVLTVLLGWIPALVVAAISLVYIWGMMMLAALNDGRINTEKLKGTDG